MFSNWHSFPVAIKQLIIVLILAVIIIAAFVFLLVYSRAKINSAPEQTIHVKVVQKRIEQTEAGLLSRGQTRIITFELSDGSRKSFRAVKPEVFDIFSEGDTGALTYKEWKTQVNTDTSSISFEKD